MNTIEDFKVKIVSLVELFSRNESIYKSREYKEDHLRQEFLNPFFKAMGWDMENEVGDAPQYKEVIHEDRIEIKGKPKAPDYSFRIGGNRKFFVEAKASSVNLTHDFSPAFQLRRYAWSGKLPVSILTDFEEFIVYDTTIEPKQSDKAETARIKVINYKNYIENAEYIYNTFSKEAVRKGSFDQFAQSEKRGNQLVDKSFLKEIESWRSLLAQDIAQNNSEIDIYELNESVQKIIDRIIFLRIAEDRGIEDYETLLKIIDSKDSYSKLIQLFRKAQDKYNSNLFDFKSDLLTAKLIISDKILDKIIGSLYYPKSAFEFSVIGVEILGSVYEQFLGKVIRLTKQHNARVEEKPEVKKAGGVYYTPQYIVEYIINNTVCELVKGKTPKEVSKLKICDPSMGSGSFLLGAYSFLLEWHLNYYVKNSPEKLKGEVFKDNEGNYILSSKEKKRILLNNIYGVDIDAQAVEVTKLSLALKMLENENKNTLTSQMKLLEDRILPDLGSNIKCGNSLIGSDYFSNKNISLMSDDEVRKVNVFDWKKQFTEVFIQGGFSVIIGNPPYVKARDYDQEKAFYREYINNSGKYKTIYKMWDLYIPFMELGIQILSKNGYFGMIVPDTLAKSEYAEKLRNFFIEKTTINQIDFFPNSYIFKTDRKVVGVKNVIIIVQKADTRTNHKVNKIIHKAIYTSIESKEEVTQNADLFKTSFLRINFNKVPTIPLGDIFFTSYGLRLNSNKEDKDKFKKNDLISDTPSNIHCRRFTEGKYIEKYKIKKVEYLEWNTVRCPKKLVRPTFPELYIHNKLLLSRQKHIGTYDDNQTIVDNTIIVCLPHKELSEIQNNNIRKYYSNVEKNRSELISLSNGYDLFYVLGIINSDAVKYYLKNLTQGGIDVFPDDWKKVPIPVVSKEKQNELIDLVKQALYTDSTGKTNIIENLINSKVNDFYKFDNTEVVLLGNE